MIILMAALALSTSPPAWKVGDEIATGADLMHACSDLSDLPRELACAYYLRGVTAMADTARQATYDRYHVSRAQRVDLTCPPPGATTFTILSAIVTRVKADAALQAGPAAKAVSDTLQKLYSCASDAGPTSRPPSVHP